MDNRIDSLEEDQVHSRYRKWHEERIQRRREGKVGANIWETMKSNMPEEKKVEKIKK